MDSKSKMMSVFISRNAMHGDVTLYEAIVRRMMQLDLHGATVNIGQMGFGAHHRVHLKRLFGVSDDSPVTITAVDSEAKLREIAPEIRKMTPDGLIILSDAEIL